jgi:hypothetical protein
MDLKRRLLGLRDERERGGERDADDRSSGHPMRRFAEFGILPGYEFPNEPCTVRLLNDPHEESPLSVERRFGLAQYQPEAKAHARGHRWRVVGLDPGSPWNPKTSDPTWIYLRCTTCGLCYGQQDHVACPRCGEIDNPGPELPGHDYGGFLAVRDDTPVLEEEDRFAMASFVRCHPQWNGRVTGRLRLPTLWTAELREEEEIRWVNESRAPSPQEVKDKAPRLDEKARGFYLCSGCGKILKWQPTKDDRPGRRRPTKATGTDPFEHQQDCPNRGQAPKPLAITTASKASTLRIRVPLPMEMDEGDYLMWGNSLGFALRTGIRQLYMLDGPEIEFELEPSWEQTTEGAVSPYGSLLLIDAAVGGSGFLERAAREMNLVAARAIDHLDHKGCESACYRCLKTYQNQRLHRHLNWPRIIEDLRELAGSSPEHLPADRADVDAPKPWLEAFEEGVGSPLELKFLRLFERAKILVEKQVLVAADIGGKSISTADFVVKGTQTAIYIDGAAFHRGTRMRRDQRIREQLRTGSVHWRVLEFRASDLADAKSVIERVRGKDTV